MTVKNDHRQEEEGMAITKLRRVVTYERVSSEDQRERATIKTQQDELAADISREPDVKPGTRYIDDGVSGKVRMALRPAGKRLLADAARGLFDEVWVWKIDRLGRDDVDPLVVWRDLENLGIKVHSVTEWISDPFMYHIHVAVAAQERRNFMARSAAGMSRAAREGRYTGGIVPLGYQVEGRKQHARLVPSDKLIWGDWTQAKLVSQIYRWLAIDGWSCRRIANHLNALLVPTAYAKDERLVRRGQRKERTQGLWRAGRIRNLVKNPVYRGELQYGRRSTIPDGREVIVAEVPALVSREIWEAAQMTLSGNRIMAKNTERNYLLKSVIRCGICGLTYIGAWGRGFVWYRCNGRLTDRGPIPERCSALTIKGPDIEGVVWDDIERFLREPGDILEELAKEREMDSGEAVAEAERMTLESAMVDLARPRTKAIDLNTRDRISDAELDELLAEVAREQEGIEKRLDELQSAMADVQEPLDADLLEDVRRRLDEGLDDLQRQEVVRLLVKRITAYTELGPEGKKAKVMIEYRFPAVVNTFMGTGSPPRPFVLENIRLNILPPCWGVSIGLSLEPPQDGARSHRRWPHQARRTMQKIHE